jgi:hypothetical protein
MKHGKQYGDEMLLDADLGLDHDGMHGVVNIVFACIWDCTVETAAKFKAWRCTYASKSHPSISADGIYPKAQNRHSCDVRPKIGFGTAKLEITRSGGGL